MEKKNKKNIATVPTKEQLDGMFKSLEKEENYDVFVQVIKALGKM
ncbi:hypothetical protein [Mycoplasmoides pneumoniae]|nr:hypothetical protein [Mycoplasmoides pneumoniae]QHR04604.1 hypothetical protein FA920_01970 [Mycoplasmoides pneumoniae]QHR06715.1 hypothetical protein FA923_01970 [Mycoplasmoides pneumoniae]QHR07416.1 hypothetical protein FA924_01965 [Mycoplasmoides pneumoniae]QHR08813.1 hypothetical protein FA926_01975 [Mycoplasmoides pneumoniae]QHR10912.1 hypothetical protein FA929_01965 [Mycoplasmoides pneumoniae]